MKLAIVGVVVVFLGFWLLQDPSGLADLSKTLGTEGWDLTSEFFTAVIDFVTSF